MPEHEFTVFIVDDDPSVRDALGLMLGVHGYRIALFGDAESFLRAFHRDLRGCLLLDIRMPGMDGLTLQRDLLERGSTLPVIVMTGHGDVDSARSAFRARAIDFIEKPLDQDKLLAVIEEACARQAALLEGRHRNADLQALLSTLTPREREVLELVVEGRHNQEIARRLGISPRTVEVHKARVLQKLRVDNLAQLVRLSVGATDHLGQQ